MASRECRDRDARACSGRSSVFVRRSSLVGSQLALLPAFNSEVNLHPLSVLLQNAVILAQGKSFPAIGQKDAFHVGMPLELDAEHVVNFALQPVGGGPDGQDRKSTRLNSSHVRISYAVFCLKKKKH